MKSPPEAELLNALLRTRLSSFIAKSFATVNPGAEFLPNWHIDLIAEYLTAASRGEITRLIINMPPRSLKSLCVSVAWPAWLMGRNPSSRIIAASYASPLSLRHAADCRLILQSDWFKAAFPGMAIKQGENALNKFVSTQRGYRLSTSLLGSITGEGADTIIVDDPLSPRQAANPHWRELSGEWFDRTLYSRLDNKNTGVIVLTMQRLHEQDLSGRLLERGGWEHLCLPAIAPEARVYSFGRENQAVEKKEALHAARESLDVLMHTREAMGSHAFSAQYLQSPLPDGGHIVKPWWLKRYARLPAEVLRRVQSWDTGVKAGAHNDASVCITAAEGAEGWFIEDVQVFRLEYPDLRRAFLHLAERHRPQAILVEDKASGQQLIQDMRRETQLPILAVMPGNNKLARLVGVSPLIEAGRLHLPQEAEWLGDFEAELLHFPEGRHDDQVDALTQLLQWAQARNFDRLRIRRI